MTITMAPYLEERLRQAIPPDHHVLPWSTPVICFGDVRTAGVATLGLNPSRMEFMTAQGGELTGDRRRLESLNSLGLSALADASVRQLETVVQRCYDYFLHQPYWRWFGQLEPILNQLGSSYNDGTACHLDLVQWATDPVWGGIKDPLVRDRLLRADAAFLGQQLAANPIRLLLLNGRSVINTVEKTYGVIFQKHPSELVSRTTKTQLVIGRGPSNIPIIGWSVNLQSSFGVTNKLKQLLAAEVGKLARSL